VADDLDALVAEAGRTHVIPPREDPALLERLCEPAVLTRARELLGSKDSDVRRRAILCLERIGYARRDQESAEALLAHARSARSKAEAATALTALSRTTPPRPLTAQPLVELARRREWQVWSAAVQCLHLANAAEVEPALLERVDADPELLPYVARELRYMSSDASLVALERLLDHDRLDVRCVALDSLGERLGAGVVPYARRLCAGNQQQEKVWAQKWLARFGGDQDVPFMAERAKRLTSSARARQHDPPEVSRLVPFLREHAHVPEAKNALATLERRRQKLPENEREWIEKHAPEVLAET
jgi:hypothetical protein